MMPQTLLLALSLVICGPPVPVQETPVQETPAGAAPVEEGCSAAVRDPLRAVAGYAAKVTASAVFVAGRDVASVRAGELRPIRPIEKAAFSLLMLEVDREAGTVRASLPGGATAIAVHRPGLGCALAIDTSVEALREGSKPPAEAETPTSWPLEPVAPGTGLDREALGAALDRAMEEGRRDGFQPTRAIVVLVGGRLAAERYAPGFDATTRHAGWSMAKTITGALIGLRAAESGLDLDAPAPVPEWAGEADPRGEISVLDLLRMSSGLAFDEDYADLTSDATWMLFGGEDVGAAASSSALAHPPGSSWSYSSGTSNLLQRVLRSTFEDGDAAYHAWPRTALFGPAGLDSALLEADATGTFVGSSFAWMTARDWARFGQLLLDDGVVRPPAPAPAHATAHTTNRRVLPEGLVELMSTPAPAARARQFGAHLWLNLGPEETPLLRTFPRLPTDLVYLSGYEGQYVLIVPSKDVVVARLGVSKGSARGAVERLVADVLEAVDGD